MFRNQRGTTKYSCSRAKPGDKVLFKPFSGTETEFEGKQYLILPYADIMAKIVETEEI